MGVGVEDVEAAVEEAAALAAAAMQKPSLEQITEVVLTAPLQGHQAVPVPRERTRRPRAPWEERNGRR